MVYTDGSDVLMNPLESIDGIQWCLRWEVEVTAVWKVRGECIVGQSNVLIGGEHGVGDEADDRYVVGAGRHGMRCACTSTDIGGSGGRLRESTTWYPSSPKVQDRPAACSCMHSRSIRGHSRCTADCLCDEHLEQAHLGERRCDPHYRCKCEDGCSLWDGPDVALKFEVTQALKECVPELGVHRLLTEPGHILIGETEILNGTNGVFDARSHHVPMRGGQVSEV